MALKRLIFILTILCLISLSACAHGPNRLMDNGGHMMGYGYTGGFMWIIFLILIGAVGYFLYQGLKNRSDQSSTGVESPLDILKRRYANGEIDKTEFDRMKKDLEK